MHSSKEREAQQRRDKRSKTERSRAETQWQRRREVSGGAGSASGWLGLTGPERRALELLRHVALLSAERRTAISGRRLQ